MEVEKSGEEKNCRFSQYKNQWFIGGIHEGEKCVLLGKRNEAELKRSSASEK
jgi:hypothetical protein